MELRSLTSWQFMRLLPGKANHTKSNLWLPTWVHLCDTAGVMRHLCAEWLPDSIRNAVNIGDDFDSLCAFLAYIHDIGKFSADFIYKISPELPLTVKENLLQTDLRMDSCGFSNSYTHGFLGAKILESFSLPKEIYSVVAAHHGKPLKAHELGPNNDCTVNLYGHSGENSLFAQTWRTLWMEWLDFSLNRAGYKQLSELPKPDMHTQMLLCGLLIMADWIASNTYYFPLIDADDTGEHLDLSERVYAAWKNLNLPSGWLPGAFIMDNDEFKSRFGFLPNTVQSAFIQAIHNSVEPRIYILEAQMGVGKTEAALCGAELLSARKNSGGIFFGLPTQATANGIFPRIIEWSRHQADEIKLAVRLAHGMAELNEDYQELFEQSHSNYSEESEGLVVHSFFSGRKQALLANMVVGTVDQLLMMALKQKHVMLRHLGMAGKIVIVDECHAYDAYMNRYLDRALCWLGEYKVPVIILSATLPEKRREELIGSYLKRKIGKDEPWKKNRGYPLLTWTDGEEVCQEVIKAGTAEKTVAIHKLPDENGLTHLLKCKLAEGGCAGVIVNTVNRAQTIAQLIRTDMPDKRVILIHAHFLMPDRAEKEHELLSLIGKNSTAEQRNNLIVVGTQVLEQSLDIDFDLMVTDLCPMDLLLQRMGRLHRHTKRNAERPPLVRDAECYVMGTADEPEGGSKAIYGEWLLYRTRQLLPNQIVLPTDIPNLVQDTYEEPDASADEAAMNLWNDFKEKQVIKQSKADAFKLREPNRRGGITGILDTEFPDDSSESDKSREERAQAAVRDGEPSVPVLVMIRYSDSEEIGFLPWRNDGRRLTASAVPCEADCREIARQQLRLPAVFSKEYTVRKTISELEEITRAIAPWQQSHWLKGELFLLLDENMNTSLSGYNIHYNAEMGLIYRKEENLIGQ